MSSKSLHDLVAVLRCPSSLTHAAERHRAALAARTPIFKVLVVAVDAVPQIDFQRQADEPTDEVTNEGAESLPVDHWSNNDGNGVKENSKCTNSKVGTHHAGVLLEHAGNEQTVDERGDQSKEDSNGDESGKDVLDHLEHLRTLTDTAPIVDAVVQPRFDASTDGDEEDESDEAAEEAQEAEDERPGADAEAAAAVSKAAIHSDRWD